ncbi:MAG: hypothetical protein WCA00_09220 [Candidatus Acidiferrales bacterium]
MSGPAICWWIGFLLVGTIFIPHNIILRRMRGAGYKTQPFDMTLNGKFNLPVEYLRIRAQHGWSPWPAYLIPFMLLAGVGFILLGLFLPS